MHVGMCGSSRLVVCSALIHIYPKDLVKLYLEVHRRTVDKAAAAASWMIPCISVYIYTPCQIHGRARARTPSFRNCCRKFTQTGKVVMLFFLFCCIRGTRHPLLSGFTFLSGVTFSVQPFIFFLLNC
jgi:hypothetical protein